MLGDARERGRRAPTLPFGESVPGELCARLRSPELALELRTRWGKVWAHTNPARGRSYSARASRRMRSSWLGTTPAMSNASRRVAKRNMRYSMFVNAALNRPGHEPGRYPSAGPLPHLVDVWRVAAPSIDFLVA